MTSGPLFAIKLNVDHFSCWSRRNRLGLRAADVQLKCQKVLAGISSRLAQ